jgi:hypothetical protein
MSFSRGPLASLLTVDRLSLTHAVSLTIVVWIVARTNLSAQLFRFCPNFGPDRFPIAWPLQMP